jgi:type I restriction enzyme S subunit
MNNMKKPQIRFKGFTDDWEQRKVGEVIEDYVEKTTVQNQYPVLTSSQQQGIVLQEDYFADRQVTTNDNVGYYVLPRGYFTYRSRSDTNLFVFNRNNLIDKGIISYYYPVFRPKNVDSNFLLRRLNNGIRSQVSMAAEGTGQHVLAHSKLKNMEFLVPSVPEQKLIGAYFEILDRLITLHQSKAESWKNKKNQLSTISWEQRKFSDIAYRVSTSCAEEELPRVEYEDINAGQGTLNKDLSEKESVKSGILFQPGDVLFGKLRPYLKNWLLSDFNGVAVGDWWVLRSIDMSSKFLYTLIQTDSYINAANLSAGSKMPRSDWNLVSNTEFAIPQDIAEQEQIGGFFSTLDDTITLHQRKCDDLQKLKKALLQQMFC